MSMVVWLKAFGGGGGSHSLSSAMGRTLQSPSEKHTQFETPIAMIFEQENRIHKSLVGETARITTHAFQTKKLIGLSVSYLGV